MQNAGARRLLDALERGFLAVDERHHDLTVAGVIALLDDDPVTVEDTGIDHGIAADLQHVTAAAAAQPPGHLQILGILQRLDGPAGGDAAEQRQGADAIRVVGAQAHATLLARHGLDVSRLHQRLDVLVQRSPGTQPQCPAQLVERRWVGVAVAPGAQVLEDSLLAACQRLAHGLACLFSVGSLDSA